jgi:DNA-binding Lrp family transcriptional regulator
MEAHRLAGEIDYILKVRVKNARAYDAFYQALISEVKIFNVTAFCRWRRSSRRRFCQSEGSWATCPEFQAIEITTFRNFS